MVYKMKNLYYLRQDNSNNIHPTYTQPRSWISRIQPFSPLVNEIEVSWNYVWSETSLEWTWDNVVNNTSARISEFYPLFGYRSNLSPAIKRKLYTICITQVIWFEAWDYIHKSKIQKPTTNNKC
jgi:hypothetical protein